MFKWHHLNIFISKLRTFYISQKKEDKVWYFSGKLLGSTRCCVKNTFAQWHEISFVFYWSLLNIIKTFTTDLTNIFLLVLLQVHLAFKQAMVFVVWGNFNSRKLWVHEFPEIRSVENEVETLYPKFVAYVYKICFEFLYPITYPIRCMFDIFTYFVPIHYNKFMQG